MAERQNEFFKSSPVDEYYLPKMNFKKSFFLGVDAKRIPIMYFSAIFFVDFSKFQTLKLVRMK
jgi:hypothetical protein